MPKFTYFIYFRSASRWGLTKTVAVKADSFDEAKSIADDMIGSDSDWQYWSFQKHYF